MEFMKLGKYEKSIAYVKIFVNSLKNYEITNFTKHTNVKHLIFSYISYCSYLRSNNIHLP